MAMKDLSSTGSLLSTELGVEGGQQVQSGTGATSPYGKTDQRAGFPTTDSDDQPAFSKPGATGRNSG